MIVVCARSGSPLGKAASETGGSTVFEFDPPAGKDGFLATNSLLALDSLKPRLGIGLH